MSATKIRKSIPYGDYTLTLETGLIARQATAAVMTTLGDTSVLVTVVAAKEVKTGADFFPLTINYQERTYAAGRIPGGYFKREGRPTEKETLTSRLIDRPLRPLFPENFYHEVQVIATVLSLDPAIDPDIVAMIGASAALAISGLPFQGPIGAARVGYQQGQYLLNPSFKRLEQSELNLVIAGTENAVLMVESEANELSEEVMLGAVMFGHQAQQSVINLIREIAAEVNKPAFEWQSMPTKHELDEIMLATIEPALTQAYQIQNKAERLTQVNALRKQLIQAYQAQELDVSVDHIKSVFAALESKIVRGRILAGEKRIDGRDNLTVRPISVETSILPRTHGSALFTRGETQALVIATLGVGRDAQIIDALEGETKDNFMLHYNFPPYSVGETGQVGSPKRREIGHGRLAKRAILAVIPAQSEFPYVLRVVSEITESNGSSSMASVCGTSLALMDAGVPIKAPVAGIAMGLIKEGDNFAILSDILGDEDHLGDMDFKVAGTARGVTALQMDIKIDGITSEIMEKALHQAKAGRMHILDIMNQALASPRMEVSDYAPRIITIKINPDKIRDVIGKGGATIRALTEETGTIIDITDDGIVKIASVDNAAAQEACRRIKQLTAEVEIGSIYEGKVAKIAEFGAFVTLLPGRDGLVHISQIANERIANVSDVLQEGQTVKVKVLEIDRQGKIRLSMKEIDQDAAI